MAERGAAPGTSAAAGAPAVTDAPAATTGKRALLVVEPRFAVEHVGVRRVISDYWERLLTRGYIVDLGVVSDGRLYRVFAPAALETFAAITAKHGEKTARNGVLDLRDALEQRIDTSAYDVSMITNPWLCDQLMPHLRFTHGVVYDLVPNLLAAQAMDFGTPNWVAAGFAYSHHRGFQFFLDSVDTILCISRSTRTDFLTYYSPDDEASVVVDIPFDVDRFLGEQEPAEPKIDEPATEPQPAETETEPQPQAAPDARTDATRVLLVNVLDPRKNIAQVSKALADVSAHTPLVIDIVGSNRLPPELTPQQFLKQLASGGAEVNWHENAPDELLNALYRSTDVLLFPSLYEGLGLPILEAQSFGTPCISSSGSSLGEVNLNRALYVDPRDPADIARVLTDFIAGTGPVVRGDALVDLTREFLAANRGFAPR